MLSDCPGAKYSLRKQCPYSELFRSVFSRFRTEYGEIRSISPYSIRMRENTDRNNSKYKHFSRSEYQNHFVRFGKLQTFYVRDFLCSYQL